jgi:nucleotidyltransferase/DNA polymerase involved in DNA repair
LAENDGRAKWVKNLARGICHEKVEEIGPPKMISASKSFGKCKTFEELEKHICLCILEMN